jgi:hypothetical protein
MASQSHNQQWGWYDEIMRGQYYDEIIPAYEALQEQMAASSSSLFLICARGLSSLTGAFLAWVRHAIHLLASPETSGREDASTLSRPPQPARVNGANG